MKREIISWAKAVGWWAVAVAVMFCAVYGGLAIHQREWLPLWLAMHLIEVSIYALALVGAAFHLCRGAAWLVRKAVA